MKAIFFGTSAFAVPSLERISTQSDVIAVVTQPDRPAGRGHKLAPTAVKLTALRLGLPVYEPVRLRTFAAELGELGADILVVAAYGRILPQSVLDVARRGIAFNVHPSLLPLYRGATPLQTAIRDGRTETGVTIIAMDAGMDTGDILVQERTPLAASETYGMLHDRLAALGAKLVVESIGRLKTGTLRRTPQALLGVPPSEIGATLTRPLGKEEMLVNWSWPARRIVDTVRAFAPAPGARAVLAGETLKLLAAREADEDERGLTADGGFVEFAGDGRGVAILRLTPPNRGPLSGADYRRARSLV